MRHDPKLKERARSLRREMTPAERILWRQLRGRRFDCLKFRRQYLFDPYILDFYCAELTLVIELDGESHLGREAHDEQRQQWLERQGLRVLRFWNNLIYDDLETVLEKIWQECSLRKLVSSPSPPTPLPQGRGEQRQQALD